MWNFWNADVTDNISSTRITLTIIELRHIIKFLKNKQRPTKVILSHVTTSHVNLTCYDWKLNKNNAVDFLESKGMHTLNAFWHTLVICKIYTCLSLFLQCKIGIFFHTLPKLEIWYIYYIYINSGGGSKFNTPLSHFLVIVPVLYAVQRAFTNIISFDLHSNAKSRKGRYFSFHFTEEKIKLREVP